MRFCMPRVVYFICVKSVIEKRERERERDVPWRSHSARVDGAWRPTVGEIIERGAVIERNL